MKLPPGLLSSLENLRGFERERFIQVHDLESPPVSIRLNPLKINDVNDLTFPQVVDQKVPWSRFGFYLSKRPSFTFDPLFHAGCYYVQEASSMFLEQAVIQCCDTSKPLRVLDLSAAPGGKTTHLHSLISPESLLVSNEVIRSRSRILEDNVIRWGGLNVMVTNNDPRDFSRLEGFFDVIVVDAPCSGSGMFRKDAEAIREWSEDNVALCCGRQKRILADVWPALRSGGLLIYSTCSYSKEENESIVSWLCQSHAALEEPISIDENWGITRSEFGYRFWPDKVKGEGLYIAACRKVERKELESNRKKSAGIENIRSAGLDGWVVTEGLSFVRAGTFIYGWPTVLYPDMERVTSQLNVIYSGVRVGEPMRGKILPHHSLALSIRLHPSVMKQELTMDHAIDYLSKRELALPGHTRGWQVVTYNRFPLGWVNVLGTRVNNYYPRELRILKEKPGK